ncbi:serine/threonine protein phosphatase [Nitrospira sp. KM1]|uniref:phosphotransferase n=1 Tax=Nitrospira sp. KM1 TaxID=1936990 RepID=UPI0013A78064|nr:phosphotransferase [Nitrospira sp. KM1]BCA55362.1 serine/threonine protein phosphatase [Nitrospira sp. KM1]
MRKTYVGRLPHHDPLHDYLQHHVQPQLTGTSGSATYRVFKLNGSNDVYLYEERSTGTQVIGKFFLSSGNPNQEKAAIRLTHEFDHLCMMREQGLTGYPHQVVKPLGRYYSMNALLVTEHTGGELLSDVIRESIRDGRSPKLYSKLTALAYFLSTFHNRTAVSARVDFHQDCRYVDRLIHSLHKIGAVGNEECGELRWLRDQWSRQPKMWQDNQVFVHGDATPENFAFGEHLHVITFDLERGKHADRVFDTGRIAGELKHFFMHMTHDRHAAEPFIGHFLWEYACHFPDREGAFRSMTGRVPFYMGMTLLRIARNAWVDHDYRRRLINEAKECWRRGL